MPTRSSLASVPLFLPVLPPIVSVAPTVALPTIERSQAARMQQLRRARVLRLLRRLRLSPSERRVLTTLAQADPAPVADSALAGALAEGRSRGRAAGQGMPCPGVPSRRDLLALSRQIARLRSKLVPHGLAVQRVRRYGYVLLALSLSEE